MLLKFELTNLHIESTSGGEKGDVGEGMGRELILKDGGMRLKIWELKYQTGRIFETVYLILRIRGVLRNM